MNEDEKYLFDLNGYLVLKEVLTAAEVAQLNQGIDHHSDQISEIDRSLAGGSKVLEGTSRRKGLGGMLAWERPWCEPWRKLLVHAKVKPYIEAVLGEGYTSAGRFCTNSVRGSRPIAVGHTKYPIPTI